MRRVVSVWLPTWPTDRLRRPGNNAAPPPDKPLVTAADAGPRRVLAAVDAAAARLGLRPGMPLAHAQALVAGLAVAEAEPGADLAALHKLAFWCQRYTPLAAPAPPDGLWLDVTGCAHLFGGEAALLRDLVARLGRAELSARAAIADTPGAAHAMARFTPHAPVLVVETGQARAALASLPVQALRLPAEVVDGLRMMGFERVEQLLAAPRPSLTLRFGPSLGRRLDQALGLLFEPIGPVFPPQAVRRHLALAEPILTPAALGQAITGLVTQLSGTLESAGLGARRLDLVFGRVDRSHQAIRVGLARPSRDASHLARLLSERLDTVDPGFGIEAITLTASLTEALSLTSSCLPGDNVPRQELAAQELAALMDRLGNRFGASRLYRAVPVESDIPERSVALVPPLAPPQGATWDPALPRPSRLLTPPERIETVALLPDHPPALFVWRGLRHRIRRLDGPERILGEWWRSDAEMDSVRDYFQAEDDAGSRFWLFRAGLSNASPWFLHGFFG